MAAHWNQQLSRYVFSKVTKYLKQNIQKQIECKRPSNTKQNIPHEKINWCLTDTNRCLTDIFKI